MSHVKRNAAELTIVPYTTTIWPASQLERVRKIALRKLRQTPLVGAPNVDWWVNERLQKAGYSSIGSVLEAARTTRQRMLLAKQTDLSASELWRTACLLDLSRVTAMPAYAPPELLSLGIYSVARLARQSSETLTMLLMRYSEQDFVIGALGSTSISAWIREARTLPVILDS